MNNIGAYAAALIPFLGCAFFFYVIMKSILESDRRERIAQAQWHAQHDALNADAASGSEYPEQPPVAHPSKDQEILDR